MKRTSRRYLAMFLAILLTITGTTWDMPRVYAAAGEAIAAEAGTETEEASAETDEEETLDEISEEIVSEEADTESGDAAETLETVESLESEAEEDSGDAVEALETVESEAEEDSEDAAEAAETLETAESEAEEGSEEAAEAAESETEEDSEEAAETLESETEEDSEEAAEAESEEAEDILIEESEEAARENYNEPLTENAFRGIVVSEGYLQRWLDEGQLWEYDKEAIENPDKCLWAADLNTLLQNLADMDYKSGSATGCYAVLVENGSYESADIVEIPAQIDGHAIQNVILIANYSNDTANSFSNAFRAAGLNVAEGVTVAMSGEFGGEGRDFVIKGGGTVILSERDVAENITVTKATVKGEAGSSAKLVIYGGNPSLEREGIRLEGLDGSDLTVDFQAGGWLYIGNGGLILGKTILTESKGILLPENRFPVITKGEPEQAKRVCKIMVDGVEYTQFVGPDGPNYIEKGGKYYPIAWNQDKSDWEITGDGADKLPEGYSPAVYRPQLEFAFLTAEGKGKEWNPGDAVISFQDEEVGSRWYESISVFTPDTNKHYNVNLMGKIASDPLLRGVVVSEEEFGRIGDSGHIWEILEDGRKQLRAEDMSTLLTLLSKEENADSGYFLVLADRLDIWNENGEIVGELHYKEKDGLRIPSEINKKAIKGVWIQANNWREGDRMASNYIETGSIRVESGVTAVLSGDFLGEREKSSDFVICGGGTVAIRQQDTESTVLPFVKGTGDGTVVTFSGNRLDLYGLDATQFEKVILENAVFQVGDGGIVLGDTALREDCSVEFKDRSRSLHVSGNLTEVLKVTESMGIGIPTDQKDENGEIIYNWVNYPLYVVYEELEGGGRNETQYCKKEDNKYYPCYCDETGWHIDEKGVDEPQGIQLRWHDATLRLRYQVDSDPWEKSPFESGNSVVSFQNTAIGYQWYNSLRVDAFCRDENGEGPQREYEVDLNGKIVSEILLRGVTVSEEEYHRITDTGDVWGIFGDGRKQLRAADFSAMLTLLAYEKNDGYFLIRSEQWERWENNEKVGEVHYREENLLNIPAVIDGKMIKGVRVMADNWENNGQIQASYMEIPGFNVAKGVDLCLSGDFCGTRDRAAVFEIKGGGTVNIDGICTWTTELPLVKGNADGTVISIRGNNVNLYGLDASGFEKLILRGGDLQIGDGGIVLGDVALHENDTNIVMKDTASYPVLQGGLLEAQKVTNELFSRIPTDRKDENGETIYEPVWYTQYVLRKQLENGEWTETYYCKKEDGRYYRFEWDDAAGWVFEENGIEEQEGMELYLREVMLRVLFLTENNPVTNPPFENGDRIVYYKDAAVGYQWTNHIGIIVRGLNGEEVWYNSCIDLNGKMTDRNHDAVLRLSRFTGEKAAEHFEKYGMEGYVPDPEDEIRFMDVETMLAYIEQDIQQSESSGYYAFEVTADHRKMLGSLKLADIKGLKGLYYNVSWNAEKQTNYEFGGFESVSVGEGQIFKARNYLEADYNRSNASFVISGSGMVWLCDAKIYRPVLAQDATVRCSNNVTFRSLTVGELQSDEGTIFIGEDLTAEALNLVRRSGIFNREETGHHIMLYAGADAVIGNINQQYRSDAAEGSANADRLFFLMENAKELPYPALTLRGTVTQGLLRDGDGAIVPAATEVWVLNSEKLQQTGDRYYGDFDILSGIDMWANAFSTVSELRGEALLTVKKEEWKDKVSILVLNDQKEHIQLFFDPSRQDLTETLGSRTKCYVYQYTENGVEKTPKGDYVFLTGAEKEFAELTVEAIGAQDFTGSAITPKVTVKDGNTVLQEGTHYTVTYADNESVGIARITVKAIEGAGYAGRRKVEFKIEPKALAGLTVEKIEAQSYTGSEIKPAVKILYGTMVLTEGKDYTVSYEDNVDVGTAKVLIQAVEGGNYTGSIEDITFAIHKKPVSELTISSIPAQTYTGSAIKPAVTVKNGAVLLKSGTDYTVSYSNNTKAGTATVTITAVEDSNYTGTVKKNFTIQAKSIAKVQIGAVPVQFYNGKAVTPDVTVKDGSKKLKKGTDYTLAYKDNKKAGTASVTVKGKGNYSGSKTVKFTILGTLKGVSAKASGYNSITVKWTKLQGVTGYKVYRSEKKSGNYKLITTIQKQATTSYKDSKLTTGKTYYYKVVPYAASVDGPASAVVSATPVLAKAAISSVKNAASKTAVVTWKKVDGANGYELYRSLKKNSGFSKVKEGSMTSYKDTKLKKGKTYYYKVRAYRKVNGKKVYGSYSDVKSVKIKK